MGVYRNLILGGLEGGSCLYTWFRGTDGIVLGWWGDLQRGWDGGTCSGFGENIYLMSFLSLYLIELGGSFAIYPYWFFLVKSDWS